MLVFLFLIDTNYVVLTLNVSEAIRQDCSSSDDTAYVVLTLGVSEKRSIRLMVERTCSVVRQRRTRGRAPSLGEVGQMRGLGWEE